MSKKDNKPDDAGGVNKLQDFFKHSLAATMVSKTYSEQIKLAQAVWNTNSNMNELEKARQSILGDNFSGYIDDLKSACENITSLGYGGGYAEQLKKAREASLVVGLGGFEEQLKKMEESIVSVKLLNSTTLPNTLLESFSGIASVVNTGAISAFLDSAKDAANTSGLFSSLLSSSGFDSISNYRSFSNGVDWLEKHKDSALYNYLTAADFEGRDLLSEFQEDLSSGFVTLDAGTWDEMPAVRPEIETEIISVLKRGVDLSDLSESARKYWTMLWIGFLFTCINNLSGIITVTTYVQGLIASSVTTQQVRKDIKALTVEQRELMQGRCVVTGDQVILRSLPGKSSDELGRISKGEILEVLAGSKDAWVHVQADIDGEDVEGWIARRYVIAF